MEEYRILVLYRSAHGTTKKYAEWIGDALNADVMEASKRDFSNWSFMSTRYDMVIMGGNINERGLNGIKEFKASLAKNPPKAVTFFCVGSFPPSEETTMTHFQDNFSETERENHRLFYFRGRLDYIGLGFIEKKIMGGLMKAIEKRYPEDRTKAESEILEAYYDDIDWSDKRSIQPLVDYVKSFMTPEQIAEMEPIARARMEERAKVEAEEEAEWEAEMNRREEMHKKNLEKAEEDKIKRMNKKRREAYLAQKAKDQKEEQDAALLMEGEFAEPADDYSEFEEAAKEIEGSSEEDDENKN